MIYRIIPNNYIYTTWQVDCKSFLFWQGVVKGLSYEEAVETVERMIKHNGGMWEATAKGKV